MIIMIAVIVMRVIPGRGRPPVMHARFPLPALSYHDYHCYHSYPSIVLVRRKPYVEDYHT